MQLAAKASLGSEELLLNSDLQSMGSTIGLYEPYWEVDHGFTHRSTSHANKIILTESPCSLSTSGSAGDYIDDMVAKAQSPVVSAQAVWKSPSLSEGQATV